MRAQIGKEISAENLFVGKINIEKFAPQSFDSLSSDRFRKIVDLSHVPNEKLMSDLDLHVKSEREESHMILCHIIEFEKRGLFLDLGYDSMKNYLVRELKYSDDVAYAKIHASRLLNQNPEINDKILDGSLKLTQLQKVTSAIQQFERAEQKANNSPNETLNIERTQNITKVILEKIENKTIYETEMVLAQELNFKPKMFQKIKPQADGTVRVELTFTQEEFEIIQNAQDTISHSVPDRSLAAGYVYYAKNQLKKIEGKSKADKIKRHLKPATQGEEPVVENKAITPSFRLERKRLLQYRKNCAARKRKYTPVKVKRAVFAKSGNCCDYTDPKSKRRCGSRYQLQVDHIIPVSRGGSDALENLRVLCGVHNRREYLKWGYF